MTTSIATPADESLLDFIPRLSPGHTRPDHLADLAASLEGALTGKVLDAYSVPPRHFKTETIAHGCAYILAHDPAFTIGYVTYSANRATDVSRQTRRLAAKAGVEIGEKDTEALWETASGGCFMADGLRGTLTGRGFRLIIIDDPHANRQEAESAVVRSRVWANVNDDVLTREDPRHGTSVIIVHTRWHPDDVIGRAEKLLPGLRYTNKPAINDRGEALLPAFYPLERLREIEAARGAYAWASLYQGMPRPRGGSVFEGVAHYTERPATYQSAIGIDLAYSGKTKSDYSLSIVLGRFAQFTYVLDVTRKQVRAPEFGLALKAHTAAYPGAPMRWYAAGTESGIVDFYARMGIRIDARAPRGDKFVRAQPVSAAWNAGKILVPKEAPWLDAFLDEILAFTGTGDAHDDQVDALAAAYDALGAAVTSGGHGTGRGSEARSLADLL